MGQYPGDLRKVLSAYQRFNHSAEPAPVELVLASPVALISIITLVLLCGVGGYMVYHFLKHAPST